MKLFNLKKNQKGFTLTELVLTVGIIAIASIAIYNKYKSTSVASNVKLQTKDLYSLSNKINSAYQSSNTLATLNNIQAIAGGLVPEELITGANIFTRFGTTITLSPSVIGVTPAYEIQFNNINPQYCGLIGTSSYANEVDEIYVNGVIQKTSGTTLTNANITAIMTACNGAATLSFRNRMSYNSADSIYIQNRTVQTNKYYIPNIANAVTSAAPACAGGAAWTGSFCSCPVGTEYNGTACVSNVNILTNCGFGTGATQGVPVCQALPVTQAQETVFDGMNVVIQNNSYYRAPPTTLANCNAANGYWDNTTNICGGVLPTRENVLKNSLASDYQGGRYIPQAMNAQVILQFPTTTVDSSAAHCVAAGGNWDGRICNYCPAPTTIDSINTGIVNATLGVTLPALPTLTMAGAPVANPVNVFGHVATSTWNVDRCVTPVSAAGPYPQIVAW